MVGIGIGVAGGTGIEVAALAALPEIDPRPMAGWSADALVVTKAIVNGGQPLKRFTAAAQGRATPIRKRTSHVEIHVDSKETE